jgi:predicted DNA-binding protein with PD1-like motif
MKPSIALALALLTAIPAGAQVLVTTPASPSDSKPNDPAVPDTYVASGQFERILVLRMKFKTDLLAGLKDAIKAQHIRNGVILAGIGSLRGFHIHTIANRDFPTKNIFIERPDTPADLVSMNGYIVNGVVHAHVSLGTGEHALNGHLEPGTEVFTYAIVTVGVLKDARLDRVDDKTWR